MQLSVTGDGYIKCVADSEEHIMSDQITAINATNLSLPCMKDRYENNVLFYHIGDNISVWDFIRTRVMDFDAIKELAVNLANVFIKLEKAGLPNQKIVADIKYIFISPGTKQLKVLQCPVEEYIEKENYQKAMGSICNECKCKNAYIAIGYILEEIRQSNFELKDFLRRVEKLENGRGGRNEAVEARRHVETQIVERRVVVNKTSYLLCGILSILFEAVGIVIIPFVMGMLGFSTTLLVSLVSFACVALITILIFGIMKLCTKKEKVQTLSENSNDVMMSSAQIGRVEGRELGATAEIHRITAPESVKLAASVKPVAPISNYDDTGLLEEEVEINPLKRQEQYHKNAVPEAYLIDEETNKKHQVLKNEFVIGRSNECDLVVNSTIVSKKHAEIVYEDGVFYVRDLRSSNFTYLNKANIEPMELYKIEDGSRIGFGNKWFIFKTSL